MTSTHFVFRFSQAKQFIYKQAGKHSQQHRESAMVPAGGPAVAGHPATCDCIIPRGMIATTLDASKTFGPSQQHKLMQII